MHRRSAPHTAGVLAVLATVALLAAACDTGDGKQLQPYDPARYPSQTSPPTTDTTAGFDDGLAALDSLPADGGVSPTLVDAEPDQSAMMQLFAPWESGGPIDPNNTCDGDDVAPALSWAAVPEGTVELAISFVDDSSVSNGEPFVHWVIGGLDPAAVALVEGDVPAGSVQALNYFGDVGYGGPCPPEGDGPHLYRLTVYALNQRLELADGTLANDFLDAIATVTIGSADLSGTYQR